jgi:nucleoside-diphosphate-sugar epimerase
MRILVTGAAGFIGSSLIDRLLAAGHEVVGIDSFEDYYDRRFKEAAVAPALGSARYRLIEANILDLAAEDRPESLSDLVRWADVVYHLAAQAGVRASWGATFATYTDNNVLATQLMLEAAKQEGVDAFVYASSSSVYGDTDVFPMREEAKCCPFSPYGVTKLAAEHLCQLYWRNFSLPTVSLRFFTVYGPRQRPDMAFHKFMHAMAKGAPIEVYGDGHQTRDFTFIEDIVGGLVAAPGAPAGSVLNLGGGSRVSLAQALDVLGEVAGRAPEVRLASSQAGDVRDTWASIDRARETIGYAPRVRLRDGLAAEWAWFSESALPLYARGESE